jgi:uncharacterized membrane protein
MPVIATLIATLALIFGGMALGILTMIHGWGLEPQSWWWIVGVQGVGQIFIYTLLAALRQD